ISFLEVVQICTTASFDGVPTMVEIPKLSEFKMRGEAMQKRWWLYGIFGALFIVFGVVFVLIGQEAQGAWSILLGGIGVFITYSRLHPEVNQKRWLRPVGIVWLLAFVGLSLLRLRTP
ncbi:MAG: hypothetical protein ABI700_33520, partial [Chloroflexota bacterium]